MNQEIEITCSVTGKKAICAAGKSGEAKLPRGWRRRGERVFSPQGFGESYVRRCLMIPVASVTVEGRDDDTHGGWQSLWESLSSAWGDATRYANLCLARYATQGFAVPLLKTEKGLRLPKIDGPTQNAWRREVYALHHDFPAIDATSAAAISLEAWETWRRSAWDVRVTGRVSLPTFRYPMPLPITAQATRWTLNAENGWVFARIRIGGVPFVLRFSGRNAGKPKFMRQIESLRGALQDAGSIGELSLIRRRRFGGADEANEKSGWQIWAAISVSMPKRPRGELDVERCLSVKLGDGALFRATIADQERVWTLNADDFIPRIALYDEARQRRSEDRKFERRRGNDRHAYQAMIGDRTLRHRRWLDVQLHRRSRELVDFARRNRCGRIEIAVEKPPTGIPLFKLLEKIKQKADEIGIIVRVDDGVEKDADPNASAMVV